RRAGVLGAARRGVDRRRDPSRPQAPDRDYPRDRDHGRCGGIAARAGRRHPGGAPRRHVAWRLDGAGAGPAGGPRRARRAVSGDGRGGGPMITLASADSIRQNIADFLSALIGVYTLIIFAWIIVSWVFSFGVRIPYSRPVNAVLDFLRDVTNPYLRIWRRLGLQFGPIDLSPMVAILVLIFGGQLIVNLIEPG